MSSPAVAVIKANGMNRAETTGAQPRLMCHCLECQRRTGAVISNQARFRREQVTFAGKESKGLGQNVEQEKLQELLWDNPEVKKLKRSIQQNGGLIEPIIVSGKDGTVSAVTLRRSRRRLDGTERARRKTC